VLDAGSRVAWIGGSLDLLGPEIHG
jgi:hypothetical protein